MTFPEAFRLVHEERVYGCRPSSWRRNGDVYIRLRHDWVLEYNTGFATNYVRIPDPELLFGDWEVLSREQVEKERKVAKNNV